MTERFGYIPPEARNEPNEKTKIVVDSFLELPERIKRDNPNPNLAKKLGSFLVNKGHINKVNYWQSWGFKYENKTISMANTPMAPNQYNHYIFRLGTNNNGETIFPKNGDDVNCYRFIHETSHAYQDYLINKESPDNPRDWHNRADSGQINSNFSELFKFCYKKRSENTEKGLSTWGNVPDYNNISHTNSQNAIRAIEDANELVTMYLWDPKYLDTFLNYVSLNIPGYNQINLNQDKLTKISNQEKENIKKIIKMYINEMKINISMNEMINNN